MKGTTLNFSKKCLANGEHYSKPVNSEDIELAKKDEIFCETPKLYKTDVISQG